MPVRNNQERAIEGARAAKATREASERPILALDTASPIVSVAVGLGALVCAERSVELRRSSERLIALVDEVLVDAQIGLRDLAGIVALRGPGSFTGLRVGLATVLGFQQALQLPATALPTHRALATWARINAPELGGCVGLVDALRGEWFVQRFAWQPTNEPTCDAKPGDFAGSLIEREPAQRRPSEEVLAMSGCLVGFGAKALANEIAPAASALEPGSLAGAAIELASDPALTWDPSTLTAPLYLRAPAVRPG